MSRYNYWLCFQVRKWRCREVKLHVQGCTAGKQHSWDSNPAVWPKTSHPYDCFPNGLGNTLPFLYFNGLGAQSLCPGTIFTGLALWTSGQRRWSRLQKRLWRSWEHVAISMLAFWGLWGHWEEGKGCLRDLVTISIFQWSLLRLCNHRRFILGELLFPVQHTRPLIWQSHSFWFLFKCFVSILLLLFLPPF